MDRGVHFRLTAGDIAKAGIFFGAVFVISGVVQNKIMEVLNRRKGQMAAASPSMPILSGDGL